MEYRVLGGTGMTVSTLCLGTMMFGRWGNDDPTECDRIVDLALDGGINFIDTADIYDEGRSEEILGEALAGRRDDVILATKFGNPMSPDPNHRGGSRRWIVRAVEDSLRRLRTDWIDVYLMHRPDPDTPLEETLAALDDLVRSGKVRAVGTSTFPAETVVEACATADRIGSVRPRVEQPPYSVLARHIERDVLGVCREHALGVMVWAPLNGGWLTGKYQRDAAPPATSRAEREPDHFDHGGPFHETKLAAVEELSEIAADEGIPLAHLALRFATEHPAVTTAIIGPRTPEQVSDLLDATSQPLATESLDRIDAVVAPGTTINEFDRGHVPSHLDPAARRRPRRDRAAQSP